MVNASRPNLIKTPMASTTTTPTRRRGEAASPPTWIKPQLAALVKTAPDGPDWLHEIKFDGYRMHARLHRPATHSGALDAGRVQIFTRRGNIWTEKYPAIAKDLMSLPVKNAYLDGELSGGAPGRQDGVQPHPERLRHGPRIARLLRVRSAAPGDAGLTKTKGRSHAISEVQQIKMLPSPQTTRYARGRQTQPR
jgi:hypothetical protein